MEYSEEYTCSCKPIGFHTPSCYLAYTHHVTERYRSLKKILSDLKKSKVGNSEVYIPKKLYHYAITLTGHSCYDKILKSINTSRMFGVTHMCYGEEQNSNDATQGWKHLHLLVRSKKFIDAKEIFVKNKKCRVDVKLLRNTLPLMKWHRYIHKETTFGECCVDTTGSEIKILYLDNAQNETTTPKTPTTQQQEVSFDEKSSSPHNDD